MTKSPSGFEPHLFNLKELGEITLISTDVLVELVEYGVIEPIGDTPEGWRFTTEMISRTQKAVRLHQDLDINWPGIALATRLLEEIYALKEANSRLKRRVNRFQQPESTTQRPES